MHDPTSLVIVREILMDCQAMRRSPPKGPPGNGSERRQYASCPLEVVGRRFGMAADGPRVPRRPRFNPDAPMGAPSSHDSLLHPSMRNHLRAHLHLSGSQTLAKPIESLVRKRNLSLLVLLTMKTPLTSNARLRFGAEPSGAGRSDARVGRFQAGNLQRWPVARGMVVTGVGAHGRKARANIAPCRRRVFPPRLPLSRTP